MILVPRLGSFDYWSGGFCGSDAVRMVLVSVRNGLILVRVWRNPHQVQYGCCHPSKDGLVPSKDDFLCGLIKH